MDEHEHKEHKSEHKEHKEHLENSEHKHHRKISMETLFFWALGLLAVILIITNVIAFNIGLDLDNSITEMKEKARPGKIELAIIKNSKCANCFNVDSVVSAIKSANVNISKETTFDFNSNEAKGLISKYSLQKIPTVIIIGEIDKVQIQGLVKKEDALILADVPAPYTSAGSGKIEGLVKVTQLKDSTCVKCTDLTNLIEQIKGAGMAVSEQVNIEPDSSEGKEMIQKYKISQVPSLILSKEAASYEIIAQAWTQVGTIESDGTYVLRVPYPPFKNLTTNEVKGVVNVIYLNDSSCETCYDVMQHKAILASPQSYNLNFDKEEIIDAESQKGKDIVAKYNITQVPTVILSKDVLVYPGSASLKQFFSEEKDGSFIFRRTEAVGIYKNLETGEVITPQQG